MFRSTLLKLSVLAIHCCIFFAGTGAFLFKYCPGNNFKHLHEVAFRKTAHSSSQYSSSYPAANALDGDVHSTLITLKENGPFLTIDLGKKFKVKRIDVYNRKDCCGERLRNLDITLGTSYNCMTLCTHYTGPSKTGSHLVFYCNKTINARYVKLKITETEFLQIGEVKVFAVDN